MLTSAVRVARAGSLVVLSLLFGWAGLMKLAYVAGKAPADFAGMASKLYPIVVKSPLVSPFGLSANQFVLLLGVFEIMAAAACFFCPKTAGIMVAAVMAGAEYISYINGSNPAMPLHPMCGGTKSTCMEVKMFHGVILALALVAYTAGAPLCKSCCAVFGSVCGKKSVADSTAENATPSRPRRAAAMKKKDQ